MDGIDRNEPEAEVLIEYVNGKNDADYLKLTSLLHWKDTSASITQNELNAIYKKLFGVNGA